LFNIGMPEIIVILIVAILVIGPKRLPEVANALGKGLSEFKRAMNNVKEELKLDEVRNDVNEMKDSLLFKNSYFDEEKEVKEEKKTTEETKVNEETKGQKLEVVDHKADKAAGESHSPYPPSPESDSKK